MSDPLLPCTTSLATLLQRLDEAVVVGGVAPASSASVGGGARAAPSDATAVASPPPPESQSRALVELFTEIAAHSAQRLCEAFPGLGSQPRTMADVVGIRDAVQSSKRWLAQLSDVNQTAADAPPPQRSSASTSKDRRRRRPPPREMATSAIVVELATNHADLVLAVVQHASTDASVSSSSPVGRHPPRQPMVCEEEAPSRLSSCVASPTIDGDDVIFLDGFDALLPQEATAARGEAPPSARSNKRHRDSDSPHSVKSVEGILERQDQLVTWLSGRLYRNLAEDDVAIPADVAAMCLCRPLVQLLGAAVHVSANPSHGGAYSPCDKVCAAIARAAEEMQDQHDITMLSTVPRTVRSASPTHQSEATTLFPVTTDRSVSVPWSRHSGEYEDVGTTSRPWGSGRRSPHLVAPCPGGDDSQRSVSIGAGACGYTAEGDRFSIPPPMVRTVSDVVRRTAPQLATHSFSAREGQISPPRSPLFPIAPASNRSSTGTSPTAPSPSFPSGSVSTAPRRLMGGQRTPATVPKRSTELPSYMLTKRRGPQKPRPSAPEQRLTSTILPSPETTLQRQPPLLVLGAGTPPTKDRQAHEQQLGWPEAPLPEDRMLFADDD